MAELSLTPKQQQAHQISLNNTITLFGGAIRGGKSYWLLMEFLGLCFQYPKSRWVIVRRTGPVIESTILPTFQTQFLDKGIHQYIKSFNRQSLTVTFFNDSQIMFMSENYDTDKELNRFRGLEINGAGADEVNELHVETFYKLIERSGSWTNSPGCPIKILLTCNPTQGWVKELFYKPWVNGTLKNGWAYVPAKITDNPHIDKNYIESLKTLPSDQYQIFVNGDWNVQSLDTLFKLNEIKRFKMSDVPSELDGKLSFIDVADEGTDYFSMPMASIIGKKIFITEVLFTQDNVDITLHKSAGMINRHNPEWVWVESNNQGSVFIKMLRSEVNDGSKILPHATTSNKITRIILSHYYIVKYFYFLDETQYDQGSDYDRFMNNLLHFMKDGSSHHDDAPDSLSGLVKKIQVFLPDFFEAQTENS